MVNRLFHVDGQVHTPGLIATTTRVSNYGQSLLANHTEKKTGTSSAYWLIQHTGKPLTQETLPLYIDASYKAGASFAVVLDLQSCQWHRQLRKEVALHWLNMAIVTVRFIKDKLPSCKRIGLLSLQENQGLAEYMESILSEHSLISVKARQQCLAGAPSDNATTQLPPFDAAEQAKYLNTQGADIILPLTYETLMALKAHKQLADRRGVLTGNKILDPFEIVTQKVKDICFGEDEPHYYY